MDFAEYLPPLYVAGLYLAQRLAYLRGNRRQGMVVDALALNWLVATLASIIMPYPELVPAYIVIDFCSALWLSRMVAGRVAGVAEIFYVGMILWNSAFFFMSAFSPMDHWWGLSILAWGQFAFVTGGVLRHDIVEAARNLTSRFGVHDYLAFSDREADK